MYKIEENESIFETKADFIEGKSIDISDFALLLEESQRKSLSQSNIGLTMEWGMKIINKSKRNSYNQFE